jgi:cardiolipin synthase
MWYFIVFVHLLGVLTAIKALMETRTSQGSIAWVIVLITFPYIALPAYWILGRSRFKGYVSARYETDKKVQGKLKLLFENLKVYTMPKEEVNEGNLAMEKLADVPLLNGNDVELLIDGDATFSSILEGIANAQSYILFQFFVITDDEIGNKIKDALMVKAKEGIKIYFLYDEIGSHKLPKTYLNALRNTGVEVYAFHTQKGFSNRFQLNFRNHRKVVVTDGKFAWIGGHNVGDEYLGKNPKFGHWRDTHIRIEGPAVMPIQFSFVQDWNWAANDEIKDLCWKPRPSSSSDKKVLIIPSGPADKLETASLMFHNAINSAKKRIWITSPYFVPDDAVLAALQLAGLRGVDVRILIPDKPDHLLVFLAAYTYFEDAAKTGVRFFRYTDGFLHQKVMLVDDRVSSVGSANFDNRSFRLNFEITGFVDDFEFAAEIEKMLLDDFSHAYEMTKSDIDDKSFGFRLATRIARLTSPIQ